MVGIFIFCTAALGELLGHVDPGVIYESFIRKWHNFKEFAEKKARYAENEENAKIIMLSILSTFYSKSYEAKNEEEFYPEFDERLKEIVGIIRRV